ERWHGWSGCARPAVDMGNGCFLCFLIHDDDRSQEAKRNKHQSPEHWGSGHQADHETDDKSSNERTDHPPHDGRIEFASHLKDVSNLLKKTTLIRFGGFFALFCFNLVSLAAGLLLGLDGFEVLFWRL